MASPEKVKWELSKKLKHWCKTSLCYCYMLRKTDSTGESHAYKELPIDLKQHVTVAIIITVRYRASYPDNSEAHNVIDPS